MEKYLQRKNIIFISELVTKYDAFVILMKFTSI
jgi:hypothetical protein